MKKERLLHAIGEIDDDLIYDAVHDTKKRKNWIKWGSLAAMLVICISAGIFAANVLYPGILRLGILGENAAANSIVLLDVNPSIALTVDANDRIVTAEGLNEDGRLILEGMDFSGADITVAVNAVIGSMLQKGYLSDLQNAILVSVENDDAEKSSALQKRVSDIIGDALRNGDLDGTVLSQTLNDTTNLDQMAQTYNISLGKAALIQEVMALDATLTVEKLAPLSITEIALISQSKNLSSDALTQNGTASNKAYISQDAAIEIAYDYANVNAQDVTGIKAEFDSEHGIMIYEIEFRVGTIEYECEIDARTGQVVKYETEGKGGSSTSEGNPVQHHSGVQQPISTQQPANTQEPADTQQPANTQQPADTQQPANTQQPTDRYIGEEAAKEAALTHANISVNSVSYINVWLDYDDGRPEHYEVEFSVGSVQYEYEIDLYSGTVLEYEMKNSDHHDSNYNESHHASTHNESHTASPSADIEAEAAKEAALSHAGLTASQVSKLKAEYDYDHGSAIYEVEFKYNGYEYEYEIDAATGAVLEYEIDD